MEAEKIVVPISVNTDELDKGIEKAEQLVELLKKANSLIDELTSKN
jgi:dsDNA-binding SOS-regulon protein